MNRTSQRLKILSQATEDFTGLWELAPTAEPASLEEVIQVLGGLIRERLVTVYRGTDFASEETALATSAAVEAVHDKHFWDWKAPDSGAHLRIFATPKGRDWYLAHAAPSSAARLAS